MSNCDCYRLKTNKANRLIALTKNQVVTHGFILYSTVQVSVLC